MNELDDVLGRHSSLSEPGPATPPPDRRALEREEVEREEVEGAEVERAEVEGAEVEREELLARLRDARFRDGVFCPRCGHREVQQWGTFSGRQRYRCKGCERTFSDLTGTPAAYLKKIELLPKYCDGLAAQLSVRRCALQLGIDPSTAFRWRHRLLDWLCEHDSETVSGWVELGSFWLPESHKGRRDLERCVGRPPRRRGSRGRWDLFYDGPRQHVVVACDRSGRCVSGPAPHPTKWPLGAEALEAVLDGRIERTASLNLTASREARSAAITFAARVGATYHDAFLEPRHPPVWTRGRWSGKRALTGSRIRRRPGARSLVHVRTVSPYIRRFRGWLRGFRGVASKYLPNYLLWHRLVDSDVRNRFQSLLLRWSSPQVAGR